MKRDAQQLPSQATPMPYAVASLADLHPNLRQAALGSGQITEEPLWICLFPGTSRLKNWYRWEYTPEQALLFTKDGIIHLQASVNQAVRLVCMKSENLCLASLSLILMYGHLELVDDCLRRVVVEFNAGGYDTLQPGLCHLLSNACRDGSSAQTGKLSTENILDELGEKSFKFRNGLRIYGLLPGEQLLGYVYQQAIFRRKWKLFNSKVTDATLAALTDKQLILVEERSKSRFPAYGWIFTFCPRRAIHQIRISTRDQWLELVTEICTNNGLMEKRILLDQENESAWLALWNQFENPFPSA